MSDGPPQPGPGAPSAAELYERLAGDYDRTADLMRTLTDVRFKLLALVPTLAGAAVGLVGRPRPAAELLAVGLLGLLATLGILAYELRNSQIHAYALERAKALERALGLSSPFGAGGAGGLFREAPDGTIRAFGLLPAGHNGGLALVYGASLAGWSYLVAWGGLRALDIGEPRKVGAALGALAGVLAVAEVERLHRQFESSAARSR